MTIITEPGITPTVTTSISSYRMQDILDIIAGKKADAVLTWISRQSLTPACVLIFGAYLTGAAIASRLCKEGNVTIVDIHPQLASLTDCRADYFQTTDALPEQNWDLIVDTTGLGGISAAVLAAIPADTLLIEDPCSDGSDPLIRTSSTRPAVFAAHPAKTKGILRTTGLSAKTSGTMTLAMEVLKRSVNTACSTDGTLYCSTATDFYERILFKERNYSKYRNALNRPALLVSSLRECNPDQILREQLSCIRSEVCEPDVFP